MSIFGSIAEAIFGKPAQATTAAPASGAPATGAPPAGMPAAPGQPAAPMSSVDVTQLLDKLKQGSGKGDLDWRKSIVDLMKLLDLDSSLKARRELADELKFTGNKGDTATMNMWLHKQVMTKLAENGGIVPDDLKS